jgi:hypothetical protein
VSVSQSSGGPFSPAETLIALGSVNGEHATANCQVTDSKKSVLCNGRPCSNVSPAVTGDSKSCNYLSTGHVDGRHFACQQPSYFKEPKQIRTKISVRNRKNQRYFYYVLANQPLNSDTTKLIRAFPRFKYFLVFIQRGFQSFLTGNWKYRFYFYNIFASDKMVGYCYISNTNSYRTGNLFKNHFEVTIFINEKNRRLGIASEVLKLPEISSLDVIALVRELNEQSTNLFNKNQKPMGLLKRRIGILGSYYRKTPD